MKRSHVLALVFLIISFALICGFGYLMVRDPDLPSLTVSQLETMLERGEVAEITVVENRSFVEVTLNSQGIENLARYEDSNGSFTAEKYRIFYANLDAIRHTIDRAQTGLASTRRIGYSIETRGDKTRVIFGFAIITIGYYFVKFVMPAGFLYLIFRVIRSFAQQRKQAVKDTCQIPLRSLEDTSNPNPDYFPVKTGEKIIMKDFSHITCFFAQNNCVYLYDQEGKEILVDTTLAALETNLPSQFMRVHRSYIVNADCIQEMKKQPGSRFNILLRGKNPKTITTGQSYAVRVKELLVI